MIRGGADGKSRYCQQPFTIWNMFQIKITHKRLISPKKKKKKKNCLMESMVMCPGPKWGMGTVRSSWPRWAFKLDISCGLTWWGMGAVRSSYQDMLIHEWIYSLSFNPDVWSELVRCWMQWPYLVMGLMMKIIVLKPKGILILYLKTLVNEHQK